MIWGHNPRRMSYLKSAMFHKNTTNQTITKTINQLQDKKAKSQAPGNSEIKPPRSRHHQTPTQPTKARKAKKQNKGQSPHQRHTRNPHNQQRKHRTRTGRNSYYRTGTRKEGMRHNALPYQQGFTPAPGMTAGYRTQETQGHGTARRWSRKYQH